MVDCWGVQRIALPSPAGLMHPRLMRASLPASRSASLASRPHCPQGLLIACCAEVEHRLGDPEVAESFSRQHLANFVWALATLEHDPGEGQTRGRLGSGVEAPHSVPSGVQAAPPARIPLHLCCFQVKTALFPSAPALALIFLPPHPALPVQAKPPCWPLPMPWCSAPTCATRKRCPTAVSPLPSRAFLPTML